MAVILKIMLYLLAAAFIAIEMYRKYRQGYEEGFDDGYEDAVNEMTEKVK